MRNKQLPHMNVNPYLLTGLKTGGGHNMVMADPDTFEMQEYEGIGIFVPGQNYERELDGRGMFKILLLTLASFGTTLGLAFLLLIPLMVANLIYFDMYGVVSFGPWAYVLLTTTEFGFIIPPIWYVRKRGFSLRSVGILMNQPLKEIVLGLVFGVAMISVNIAITWVIAEYSGIGHDSSESPFIASDWVEVIGWIVVMFVAVGFSEELLFRGFLQKRMEIYFRAKSGRYKLLALVITSALFAAMHFELIGLLTRFILGLFLGYLCQKRKYSILGPSIAHGFNNSMVIILVFLGF